MSRGGLAVAMASPWQPISGGVTAPKGFLASASSLGLSPPVSLICAAGAGGGRCVGTFTTSVVRAACVDLCSNASPAGAVRPVRW